MDGHAYGKSARPNDRDESPSSDGCVRVCGSRPVLPLELFGSFLELDGVLDIHSELTKVKAERGIVVHPNICKQCLSAVDAVGIVAHGI
jgi:hypothetical protein